MSGMTLAAPELWKHSLVPALRGDPVPRVLKHNEPHDRQRDAISPQPPSGGTHRSGAKPHGWNCSKLAALNRQSATIARDDARWHVDGGATAARTLVYQALPAATNPTRGGRFFGQGFADFLCRRAKTMEALSSSSRATEARMRLSASILGTAGNGQEHQESRKAKYLRCY